MLNLNRRQMLKTTSCGFGYLAFAGLAEEAAAKEFKGPLAPKKPHFPAKAKRVIFMCMQGGPSHVDMFDYKPMLKKFAGKNAGDSGKKNKGGRKWMPSPWKFNKSGKSGIEISELFPHLSKHADDLCLINSAYTDLPNHPQATVKLHTGNFQFTRPSMGAWAVYGLGTESKELPGFIAIDPTRQGGAQNIGSAFLPAMYQGTGLQTSQGKRSQGSAISKLTRSQTPTDIQRKQIDLIQGMNRDLAESNPENTQIDGVIESYELAFRMQASIPKLMDLSTESQATQDMYGIGNKATDRFARQCLMARRFAEEGVRFIELSHNGWDQHKQLRSRLTTNCTAIDQPIAALFADLKQRDMLKDTLIIWSGEFGRTPGVRNNDGRDHNSKGFSMWMAGGGVQGGMRYGATDDFGVAAVEDKFHIHDFHATMLHLLGMDHKKLTYRYAGRDFRLTDVHGNVAKKILKA